MSSGTTTAVHIFRFCLTGDKGGQPVAMFDPGVCVLAETVVCAKHMRHLGPYPFGGIDAAFICRVVNAPTFSQFVDLGSFPDSGMVLPEHEHRIRVLCIFRQQGEGSTVFVCQDRSTSGRIESDANHFCGCSGRTLCQRFFDCRLQPFDIIQRMLAIAVFCWVTVFPFHPARIILDSRSDFFACGCIHDYGATGVATVVKTYNILFVCHSLCL